MVSVRGIVLLLLSAALPAVLPISGTAGEETLDRADGLQPSLFAQSASRALSRAFQNRDVSFLLLDAGSGAILASRWNDPTAPIPLGSLVKPFVAIAYGQKYQYNYPVHFCRGTASGCWLPRGHGNVNLSSAIAYSCNSYFRSLTDSLTASELSSTVNRFGLEVPDPEASGPALIGLGNRWRISPARIARAYLELVHRHDQPGVREILAGMEMSASHGTGAGVDRALPFGASALVKTGTAACTHSPRSPGDGFSIVLAPADHPRILLMVRVHGVPGSEAAKTAALILLHIQE